jgi:hypothetical protein
VKSIRQVFDKFTAAPAFARAGASVF